MTKKPRVLFVLPATVMGGAEIRLINMINAFRLIEPVLAGHRTLLTHASVNAEIHWLDDCVNCFDPYPYDWANVRRYASAVAILADRIRPAVTFGWMHNGSSFVAIAKLFHHLRGATAGCILGPLTDHFALNNRTATPYERLLFGFACRHLNRMIAPSNGVREDLILNFFAPRSRVETIYNGVDLKRVSRLAADAPDQPIPKKQGPWILAASRLSLEKGLDVMIRAFAGIRASTGAILIILGEGPQRQYLENLSQQLGIAEQVWLPGYIKNPFPWLVQADVFTMASRLEGFGTALVEAMALGIPVVSTACRAGPREILAEEGSGILVPVDDEQALASALERLILDPALHAQLSAGARRRATQFGFDAMLKGYENLLCHLARA
ncbi:MAG: glycosyltransferase [Chromatiaceae bacterium]|nr:glycosyltransferase [Chromatiaceae bacterium]